MQGDEHIGQSTLNAGVTESESNDILRFELLRNELIELEKRVQRSTDQSENEEVQLMLLTTTYMILWYWLSLAYKKFRDTLNNFDNQDYSFAQYW